MKIVSVRALIALLLLVLPVCWGGVFPGNTIMTKVESLSGVSEAGAILLFGMALFTLTSFMRIRTTR